MKKTNKLINIVIISSIITYSIISFYEMVYAQNETSNTNANTNKTNITENSNSASLNTSTTTNTTSENKTTTSNQNKSTGSSSTQNNDVKTVQNTKSSNTNLSNLGITPNDFKGFKAQTTTYNVTVPSDLNSVTIYATAQDSNANISGIGKKDLTSDTNKFEIIVTAENGDTKTYTLNITKTKEVQNTENVQAQYTGDGLATLNIENVELSPQFDTIVYEYTGKYIGEATNLNINATTTDPYYEVEITGNENLEEGENIINILVTDPDGNNVAVYQINVNKTLVDEEAIAREKEQMTKWIIIGGIIGAIVIIIVIIIIIRKKRKNNLNYDDEFKENDYKIDNYQDKKQINDYKYYDDINYTDEESLTKEEAREKFLSNYNKDIEDINNEEIYEDEEEIKKGRRKGKRFK